MSELKDYLKASRERHLGELLDFLRIPSVSTDPDRQGDVRRAAEFVAARLGELGLEVKLLETAGHPAVFASSGEDEGLPTVLVYGHYDVQPPDPLEEWTSPPFEPLVEEGRIVARGASDDKGQVYAHVKAVESLLASRSRLPVNVKFLIEGEEEIGSANLGPLVQEHQDLLAADVILISDGAMIAPGSPTITYGLKGLCYLEVRVQGASRDLHSGAYGGGVPNPIQVLAGIIAGLKDERGRIPVPGFYDEVVELGEEERRLMAEVDFDERAFAEEVGLEGTPGEEGYSLLERLWARPTLDVNGITGGFQGEGAKTVIPSRAMAKISCRLVPDQDPDEIAALMTDYVHRLTPAGVKVEVVKLHGGKPMLTARDSPASRAVASAAEEVYGRPTVFVRTGGTIGVASDFQRILGAEMVLLGLGLESDRLHSPNEKFDLDNYYRGIEVAARALEALATMK